MLLALLAAAAGRSCAGPTVMDTDLPLVPPGRDSEALAQQCVLCHSDVMGRVERSPHGKARAYCASCHGSSHAHRESENNAAKPEVSFRVQDREMRIEALCSACHREAALELRQGRHHAALPPRAGEPTRCTDCHDPHR
ncbi:MAG: hypothetical protein AB1486_30825 [Planctomycetota bacterium]